MYKMCHIMYLAAVHMLWSAHPELSSSRLKTAVALAGLLMVLYPLLPETPYWLVLNGDLAGADAVLQRMAKINGVHLPQVTPCDTCMWRQSGTAGGYSRVVQQGGTAGGTPGGYSRWVQQGSTAGWYSRVVQHRVVQQGVQQGGTAGGYSRGVQQGGTAQGGTAGGYSRVAQHRSATQWQALQNRPRAACIDMITWQHLGSHTPIDHFCMCWWTVNVVHAARNTWMTTVACFTSSDTLHRG